MQNISWYLNLYYSYRDYPIKSINIKYKKSELKAVYSNLMKKMFMNLDIQIYKEIEQSKIDDSDPTINQKLKGEDKHIHFQDNNSIQSLDRSSNPDLSDYNISLSDKQSKQNFQQQHDINDKNVQQSRRIDIQFQNQINRQSIESSQIASLHNIKSSKQIIMSNQYLKKTNKKINQIDIVKICQTMDQNQRNMDVFYELMIKMIRLTLKKISIELDQELKKKKRTVKNVQTIQQQNQEKQNQQNQDDISSSQQNKLQSKKSIPSSGNHHNQNDFMRLEQLKTSSKQSNSSKDQMQPKYTFVISYANKLSKMKQKRQAKEQKQQKQRIKIDEKVKMFNMLNDFEDQPLNRFEVPNSVEQIKYQFLKYCTLTKINYQKDSIYCGYSSKNQFKQSNGLISSKSNILGGNNIQKQQSCNKNKSAQVQVDSDNQQQKQKFYIAQLTQLSDKQTDDVNAINQQSTYQIQKIVLKLVNIQMNSFNIVLNHYFSKLQQNSTIVNVIGFDAIAQSMYQMDLGQQAKSNGISMQVCLGDSFKSNIFANYRFTNKNSQSNNILLQTWLDLVIFSEQPSKLFQIIEEMSNVQNLQENKLKLNSYKSKTWTPDICQTPLEGNQGKQNKKASEFRQKMVSLMNYLILNTTKSIFLQSLSKSNFISVVMIEMLSNQKRSLKQFELRKLKNSVIFQSQKQKNKHQKKYLKHCLNQEQVITCYDLTFQKQVWKKQALNLIIYKWNKIIKIIFQEQVKNPKIYWQLIFQKCASMLNRQLSLLAALFFYLMQMYQNLEIKIKQIKNSNRNISKKQKHNIQKHQKIQKDIENIIRQHIGCRQIFGKQDIQLNQNEQFIYSNFNNISQEKNFQRKKEQSFANRQEKTQQLHKWEEALRQNIFIYQQYIDNIVSVNQMFKKQCYFKAAWFINYHQEAKFMIKKVKKQNLRTLFIKFNSKLPNIWQSLNRQQKSEPQQNKKSLQKRHQAIRYRLSSIKRRKQLSDKQKKSLIINYMIKTELELYQSYTKSHILNSQQDNTTMTTIMSSVNALKTNLPFIFQDQIIRSLLLFPLVKISNLKNVPQTIQSNIFSKRTDKPHLTMKINGLSQFAPIAKTHLLSPRQFKVCSSIGRTNNQKKTGSNQVKNVQQDEPFINEYEIDISKLESINYQNQQIQFLIQLNDHLKFINQINFQYEYYHWKKSSYQKLIQQNKKGDQIRLQYRRTNQSKSNLLLRRVISTSSDNKSNQMPELQALLTTQQLQKEIKEISKIYHGNRSEFFAFKAQNNHFQNNDAEDQVILKYPYKQKIDQIIKRIKMHNQSLRLIVEAALEAKNFWRSATDNIIPEQLFQHFDSKKYQPSAKKKMTQVFSQLQLQDRYFGQKILQKMEQYINDYRQLCHQMKYAPEQLENQQKKINQEYALKRNSQSQSIDKVNQNERSLKKKPSIIKIVQQNKKPQARFYSLIESLICRKQTPKMNRFQIASQFYQLSEKILRVNCYMASFYVERKVFKNIVSSSQLSQEKYAKVKIIGKKYFQKVKQYALCSNIQKQNQFSQETLKVVQNIYQKKILIILVSLMELIYKGNEQKKNFKGKWKSEGQNNKRKNPTRRDLPSVHTKYQQTNYQVSKKTMKKYSELVKKYLKYRLQKNTQKMFQNKGFNLNQKQANQGVQSDFSHIPKLISEAFQFAQQSSSQSQSFNQQKFILNLKKMRFQQTDQQFLKAFVNIAQKQIAIIEQFDTEQQKCQFLKKKFYYFVLRELYFYLYYDIDCLQPKSAYSKKNYELYQNRIIGFYDQIIKKSYHDFQIKKQFQLKKRSIYLQNYLLKYEEEPIIAQQQKSLNKLLVCLFNQIMIIYTQQIKVQMKKKSAQINDIVMKNISSATPLHHHYFSTQFYTQKKVQKEDFVNQPSSSNNVLQMFEAATQGQFKINFKKSSFGRSSNIQFNTSSSNIGLGKISEQNQIQNKIQMKQEKIDRKNEETFTAFSLQGVQMCQAINIYRSLKIQYLQNMSKQFSKLKFQTNNKNVFKREMLTQMQLQIIKSNQESLVSLLKKQVAEKINKLKFNLVRKNLISRIQKLYINIDVRHKVFQSFQDKILSYEMQKAKIYHQYMDYIRGLKLDVYSHIANEDSLPYIKIINAIKLYRLQIKKQELQNKVSQQFGKNLNRWNEGIQQDLKNYNSWLSQQQKYWVSNQTKNILYKKQLLQIYDSIQKQLKRQVKKRQKQQKQLKDIQNLKSKNMFIRKASQVQKQFNQLKKIAITKMNNPFSSHKQNMIKAVAVQLPKQQEVNKLSTHENNVKKHSAPKSATFHCSKSRQYKSLNHSIAFKGLIIQNRFLVSANKSRNSLHSKQKTLYRASTAVTRQINAQKRQKEFDKSQNAFRGIKMKYFNKSMKNIQISNIRQSSSIQNSRVFKKTQIKVFNFENSHNINAKDRADNYIRADSSNDIKYKQSLMHSKKSKVKGFRSVSALNQRIHTKSIAMNSKQN